MAERNLIDLWNEYCCEEMGGELVLFENTRENLNNHFYGMKPWEVLLWVDLDDYNVTDNYYYFKLGIIHSTNNPASVICFSDLDEYCGRVYDKSYEELCFDPEDGE
jgi:hypothetical protein